MSKVVIENTKPRLHHLGADVRLLPGRNEVDAEAWVKWRSNDIVQAHIRYGDLVEVDVKALDVPPEAKTADPVEMPSVEAAEVVEPKPSKKKKRR